MIRPAFVPGYTGDIARRSDALSVQVRDGLRALGSIPTSTYAGRDGIDTRTDLGGLTLSDVPKAFVEHVNMRNPVDARLLASLREQERIAGALAAAVIRWHRTSVG